jgi:hypothetical protein
MDFADAVRQLEPHVAWQCVRTKGGGVNVEDRCPLRWDPGVLPSAARFADNSGCRDGLLVRGRHGPTRSYPEAC